MATSTASKKAKKSTKGRQRSDGPKDYWTGASHPVNLGSEEFRTRVIRGDKRDTITLDDEVTALSWDDSGGAPTASVTIQRQQGKALAGVGHLFIAEYRTRGQGSYKEVWRMRATDPERHPVTGEQNVDLIDDLDYLRRSSQEHFKYGKSKRYRHGPRIDQVIRWICAKYKQPVGKLPKMNHRVLGFTHDGSPYDALVKLLKIERDEGSGRPMVMRTRAGKLVAEPLTRPKHMTILGPAIIDATIKQSISGNYRTIVTVRGTASDDKKHKHKSKLSVTVRSDAAIRRFGYIHEELTAPKGVKSVKSARYFGRRTLAQRFKPKNEVTFTHPGIPTARRFDAVRIEIPDEGIDLIAYISEVRHNVTPGDYTMEVTCRFTDPFDAIDAHIKDVKRKRCEVAKKRHRKLNAECRKLLKRPKPKKAAQRR